MGDGRGGLSREARSILEEEEALLRRVREVLRGAAREVAERSDGGLRSVDSLRELRDEATAARSEDLPALLLELSIRQRLRDVPPATPPPDPACPYLAHLRLREGDAVKEHLLGRGSFLEPRTGVKIVDWRVAPVAQIFYRYREGEHYEEEFPGRTAEGVVVARRIVVISRGEITQIVTDRIVRTRQRGGWTSPGREGLSLAPGGAGSAARPGSLGVGIGAVDRASADVTARLDAEQYAAIAFPPEEALLVLGSAGSGKTTVALRRLSRIATRDPARFPLARVRVVVPEQGLARLTRRLLATLGVGDSRVKTLDESSLELAREVFGPRIPTLCPDPPALVAGLKRHPALYRAVTDRASAKKPERATLRHLRRRLATLLTDRGFLATVVDRAGGELSRGAIEETVRHTLLQLADPIDRQLRSITVAEKRQAIDGLGIEVGTPEELAGTLDPEDLPILLHLRALGAGLEAERVAHLVLDEAEDFSLFDLAVLRRLLGDAPSFALAGDEAQQTSSGFAGWPASLATLGAPHAATCRLSVSYRCPRPVAELARRILGSASDESRGASARDGAPVGVFFFPDEASAQLFLSGALADLAAREPRASVAVIAASASAAARIHELVRGLASARRLRRELPSERRGEKTAPRRGHTLLAPAVGHLARVALTAAPVSPPRVSSSARFINRAAPAPRSSARHKGNAAR